MNTRHNLQGFQDANLFSIVNGIPRYNKTGNTYMEIFRSGISLDDIYYLNQNIEIISSTEINTDKDLKIIINDQIKEISESDYISDISEEYNIHNYSKLNKQTYNYKNNKHNYYRNPTKNTKRNKIFNLYKTICLNKISKRLKKNIRNNGTNYKNNIIHKEQENTIITDFNYDKYIADCYYEIYIDKNTWNKHTCYYYCKYDDNYERDNYERD